MVSVHAATDLEAVLEKLRARHVPEETIAMVFAQLYDLVVTCGCGNDDLERLSANVPTNGKFQLLHWVVIHSRAEP